MFMVQITTVAEGFSNNNVVYLWQCNQLLNCVYIGEGSAIMPATMTRDSVTLVLALATLSIATEIEMILIDKASIEAAIVSQYFGHFCVQTIDF